MIRKGVGGGRRVVVTGSETVMQVYGRIRS